MAAYGCTIISILKNQRNKTSFYSIFKEILETKRTLMCRFGMCAAFFTFLHKFFRCIMRAYIQ